MEVEVQRLERSAARPQGLPLGPGRTRRPRVCSLSVEHLGFSTLADIIHLNILRIVFEAAYNTGTLSLRDLTSCFSICYVSTSNFLLFR